MISQVGKHNKKNGALLLTPAGKLDCNLSGEAIK
jgi:hypothetical protein